VTKLLDGKSFLVTGAANSRSIAWAVAKAVTRHGGAVALTYQDELGGAPMIELDVGSDAAVKHAVDELQEQMPVLDGLVHSIAWAPAHDLQGNFVETTRDGFAQANDISSYSLIATAREARRQMSKGGAIVTKT
jgi:enoyl-[acyl-carrier protein] reductase I